MADKLVLKTTPLKGKEKEKPVKMKTNGFSPRTWVL